MKKLALIGTFCHNQEQLDTLKNTILEWKKLNVDTLVLSPLHLPQDIIELCDYYFYTKDNPLLHWPQKGMLFQYAVHGITFNKMTPDYGWARLFQMKKLAEIASTYDYDIFYQTEYDLLIDEYVKNLVNNNTTNLITRRINPKNLDEIFGASLHFISLDKENLIKVKNHTTLERYLENDHIVAEGHAIIWSKELNIPIDQEGYVIDTINNFDKYNMVNWTTPNFYWNESLSDDYKIFFENQPDKNFRFVIWHINGNKVNISVNGKEIQTSQEWIIHDSLIPTKDIKSIIINEIEYIDVYNKIYHNKLIGEDIVERNAPLLSNL
tara:strand:+ start:2383 stop:3351 length:969 start_codon:yes stop_codon:yes gene_type:complete